MLENTILQHSDIEECVGLVVRAFDVNEDSVRNWFARRIVNNPWQKSLPGVGVGIRDRGRLVGCRTMFGQPWWLSGESTTLAFASFTAVDDAYRGCGLGTALIEESRRFAPITGSTSAGNITQKAYRKLGFVSVGGLDNDFFRVRVSFRGSVGKRVGRFGGALAGSLLDLGLIWRQSGMRIPHGFRLVEISRCEREFDDLWIRARPGYRSCLQRTSSYLNWRIFDNPTVPMQLAAIMDRGGDARAFAVWHEHSFGEGIKCIVLRDLFCCRDDGEAKIAALRLLMRQWRERDATWASIEVADPSLSTLFRRFRFTHIPSNGNRYHVFRDSPLEEDVLEHWFRSGLDGDYLDASKQ